LKMMTTSSGIVKRWFFLFNDALVYASIFGREAKSPDPKKSVHQREEKSNRRFNFRRMILFEADDFRIKDTIEFKDAFQMIR